MNYIWNPEGERIAQELIDNYHPHLQYFGIAYLFKPAKAAENTQNTEERPKRRGRKPQKVWIAKCALVNARYRILFARDYQFIITADQEIWDELSEAQRIAVMDHELCHAVTDEEGNPKIRRHDLEEFRSVVARHGMYLADIQAFAEALRRGEQVANDSKS